MIKEKQIMKKGDIAKVLNDDGGHFFKGAEVEIEEVLSDRNQKPVLTRMKNGQTHSWYAKKDLEVVMEA